MERALHCCESPCLCGGAGFSSISTSSKIMPEAGASREASFVRPSVPKLYPIRAVRAVQASGAARKISKLYAFGRPTAFKSHPRLQILPCKPQTRIADENPIILRGNRESASLQRL